jgi:glycosyltransferase involved in cell wall biosynthesis
VLRYLEHAGPRAVLEKMVPIVGRDSLRLKQSLRGVCFVAPELDRIGGYELATLALAQGLRERGISVMVVTITNGELNAVAGADLIRIDVRGQHTLLSTFPRLLAVLARERSRYSVIHCSTFGYMSGLAVLAGRILGRRTLLRVATERDVREFAEGQHWKYRLFFWLLRGAARVIAPSVAIRDELLRAGFSSEQVVCFANAVDVNRFRPVTAVERVQAKSALGLPKDTVVIGTVARLVQRKGIDVLLRAFGIVRQDHQVHLIVVGDGPLGGELRALARELRIEDSISWTGFQADPVKWLEVMDVFAFPSRLEGVPNAVLEAMAAGLPIVSTTIGGVVDIVEEGRTGFLISPDDPQALAGALDRLLGNAPLRADLGYRARARAVEIFSLSDNISRLTDLYLSLQDRSSSWTAGCGFAKR